jgi:N-acetylmuramic acid 6-phosphate (MurNAc-6-P) etherase
MVSEIGGCDETVSQNLLGLTDGSVKHAILLAGGVPTFMQADELLKRHSGNLRTALATVAEA